MMEQELLQLEKRMSDLLSWKKSRERERLTSPLDLSSRKTLDYYRTANNLGLLIFTEKIGGLDAIDFANPEYVYTNVEVSINGHNKVVILYPKAFPFTANFTTNVLTSTNGQHNLNNGDRIRVLTNFTLPDGLAESVIYFIIDRTGNTFKVSTSLGGSEVDILDNGTGTHYFTKI